MLRIFTKIHKSTWKRLTIFGRSPLLNNLRNSFVIYGTWRKQASMQIIIRTSTRKILIKTTRIVNGYGRNFFVRIHYFIVFTSVEPWSEVRSVKSVFIRDSGWLQYRFLESSVLLGVRLARNLSTYHRTEYLIVQVVLGEILVKEFVRTYFCRKFLQQLQKI